MKKNLFVLTLLSISCCSFAQIFQENFDGNGPGISAWTIIDADGLTPTPEVAFITSKWSAVDRKGPNADFGGPAGNFAAASTSWFDPVGTANDWLISPKLSISGTSPYLTWEAKAQDANYFDGYKVMLSTNGGNTIADFDVELMDIPEEVHTASGEPWKRRFISLIPYIGKDIRFAIVNNSDNKFVLLVDDFRVGEFTPPAAPNCPKLISPINESTNISFLPFTKLEWTPDNLGGTPLDYDLYFSDEVTAASLETNTIDTNHDMYWLEGDKTYYWKVIAKNEGGTSTNCPVYSFKTEIGPMAPYCGPLDFSFVEPITNVSFSNLNNTSNASYDSPSHEKFTDKIANLNKGETYTISLQGNTGGNFKNRFIVFIDWNKNNVFDTDETYIIPEALENSTGVDGKKISMDITTPTTASKGEIRMRVKKVAGE
ncbi:choice-of-anchor J domain-containing protein, partial [Algoriella sp.]|uniref:choice-of-anchor J domain-containing protein n=1 Tax=Algoriella sp. TaxID=1872434 RepID=UPI001B12D1DC